MRPRMFPFPHRSLFALCFTPNSGSFRTVWYDFCMKQRHRSRNEAQKVRSPPSERGFAHLRAVRCRRILLKNSNFRGDHNSEDRWQPRWKFPWGLSGATDLSAYDALLALAVASTRGRVHGPIAKGRSGLVRSAIPAILGVGVPTGGDAYSGVSSAMRPSLQPYLVSKSAFTMAAS